MKRVIKRKFSNTVEHARGCAVGEILGFLKSDEQGRRDIMPRLSSMLGGLMYCGAMSMRQFQRMSTNIVNISIPEPLDVHGQIAEALERR